MAVTKFLARDLKIEIAVAGSGGSSFIAIKGLTTLTHAPSAVDADGTDFDSDGAEEHIKAQRGHAWTLVGRKLEDVVNGDYDPGQAAVETLALAIGLDSLGTFKLTSPGGNTQTFSASAEVTKPGGGNNDLATWQAVIKVSGPIAYG